MNAKGAETQREAGQIRERSPRSQLCRSLILFSGSVSL